MNPPARCQWQRADVSGDTNSIHPYIMGKLLAFARTEGRLPTRLLSCNRMEKVGAGCAPELSPPRPPPRREGTAIPGTAP
jgi:hypothetical protein